MKIQSDRNGHVVPLDSIVQQAKDHRIALSNGVEGLSNFQFGRCTMRAVLFIILLFAVLWPHAGVSQTTATSAKISCPQCGVEVKPEASFCPQCGASLPKLARATDNPNSPRLTTVPSGIDSTALMRQELVRMLLADPEFDRMLTQKIQRAVQQAPASSKDVVRYERHSDPLGGVLKVVGLMTSSLLLIALL
jgi:hypothetical protein